MQWQQSEVNVVVKEDCFRHNFHRQLSAAECSLVDGGRVYSKPRPLFKLGVALGSCSDTDYLYLITDFGAMHHYD